MPSLNHVDAYLRERAELDPLAPSTLRGYREELRLLLDRHVPLTREGLSGFLSVHPNGALVAPNTRNRRLAIVRAFTAWLVREGHLAEDPTTGLRRARVPQGFAAALGENELKQVLGALLTSGTGWRRTRDLTLVLLPFYTGLRVTELHRLDVRQVDLLSATLRSATRKGGGATDVLLHPSATRVLRAWLRDRPRNPSAALFLAEHGERLGVRSIQKVYEGLRRRARLAVPFHPHRLRHAYATALLGKGVSLGTIQRLMNHASIQTTSRYLHADEHMMRAAVALLPSVLEGLPKLP